MIQKNVNGPKFDSKTGFTLPFNENNPLNFVKPITVNIYFKQANPAVGSYNPEKMQRNIPACVNVFQSAVGRGDQEARRLEQQATEPAPTTYDALHGFDLAENEKGLVTSSFRPPIPKKIVPVNLYNPHAEVEDDKKKIFPGPGTYKVGTQFFNPDDHQDIDKVYSKATGKVYVDNNSDRFGQPILPRKPRELIPGPGEYNVQRPSEELLTTAGGFMGQTPLPDFLVVQSTGVPGPAYYNSAQEPKKISFLFNAAEKWTT